ncbi:LCP family protein [Actinokineospora fastidiosa]|uniref:LytTR family transcriptional regulator n=1 Tax=Actinokineospora fastidiosa TaxID=1816 RepID=A0A918GJW2_9PSEU|nr:LCP family protein [Actinokineospora fastidiosa]GGS42986.1 LytTR family transcriptional regulator [Actinokineospora fastidiosa]
MEHQRPRSGSRDGARRSVPPPDRHREAHRRDLPPERRRDLPPDRGGDAADRRRAGRAAGAERGTASGRARRPADERGTAAERGAVDRRRGAGVDRRRDAGGVDRRSELAAERGAAVDRRAPDGSAERRRAAAERRRAVPAAEGGAPPSRRPRLADLRTERIAPKRPAPRPVAAPPRRPGLMAGKAAAGALSAVVLAATGYYWQVADDFSDGLATTDVIAMGPTERPADGAIDILMVGMDSRTDAQGNPLSEEQLRMLSAGVADGEQNTDTIIMIRIPNDGKQAYGVSIPRDSYVDIPGYGKHKVNSAYARAKIQSRKDQQAEGVTDERELERVGRREGAKSLIATVQELTGATIDHYAEVNLLGFYDITNAVGGIEVCLKEPVRDRYSGANFPAGVQTLKGVQALAFVRQRHGLPNGDLDRIVRQQTFMTAMARKVFSQDMILPGSEKLTALQEAIKKSVVLDEGWNIIQFAQQMVNFTGGNLEFLTIPHGRIDLPTPYDGSAVEIDPLQVQEFVDSLLRGGPSAPGEETRETKPTVTVLNATGRRGLAGEVTEKLQGAGYQTGEPGNSAARSNTVIRHATGEEAGARGVASALGGDYTVEPDANLGPGQVKVFLGADYESGGQSLAADPLLALNGARQGPPCVN